MENDLDEVKNFLIMGKVDVLIMITISIITKKKGKLTRPGPMNLIFNKFKALQRCIYDMILKRQKQRSKNRSFTTFNI